MNVKRILILLAVFSFLTLDAKAAGDPLRKAAKKLAKSIQKLERPKVGLLAFPYHNGDISSGSSIISERLTTYLAEVKNIRVVERSLIRKILEEKKLSETGVIDQTTAKQLGKILGVDVIVTGTLIDLDSGRTEVNARSLLANSGEVIGATRVEIKRTWKDNPRSQRPRKRPQSPPDHHDEEDKKRNEPIEIGYPGRRGGYGGGGRR